MHSGCFEISFIKSSYHSFEIGNFYASNIQATVTSITLFLMLGSCYHYLGGIILLLARYIATVYPSLFYNSGLWFHYDGGIIPFLA